MRTAAICLSLPKRLRQCRNRLRSRFTGREARFVAVHAPGPAGRGIERRTRNHARCIGLFSRHRRRSTPFLPRWSAYHHRAAGHVAYANDSALLHFVRDAFEYRMAHHVRRSPGDKNDQSMSQWIHEECRVGDRLRVRGPRGAFTLDRIDSSTPVVFLAAGVGITPMASMILDALNGDPLRRIHLFWQVRNWEEAPLLMELIPRMESSPNCQAVIAASQATRPVKLSSKSTRLQQGRMKVDQVLESVDIHDSFYFLCGPHAWMKNLRAGLVAHGIDETHILDEAFAAPKRMKPSQPNPSPSMVPDKNWPTFRPGKLLSRRRGKRAVCSTSTASLWSLAKQHSISIPASCRAGNCGTCAVKAPSWHCCLYAPANRRNCRRGNPPLRLLTDQRHCTSSVICWNRCPSPFISRQF